jgi:hypothetical protein
LLAFLLSFQNTPKVYALASPPSSLDPELLLTKLNASSYDEEYGGYYYAVADDQTILDSSKYVGTDFCLIRAYLDLAEYTSNSSYLNYAIYLASELNYFKLDNGGYVHNMDVSWDNPSTSIYFTNLCQLADAYNQLYIATGYSYFLDNATSLIDFIYDYYYDETDGGFYHIIDSTTLLSTFSTRYTAYYGLLLNTLHGLYVSTNNETYLDLGFQLITETVTLHWNSDWGYFYPKLNNYNTPYYSSTSYVLHEQLVIAKSLLYYAQYERGAYLLPYAETLISVGINNSYYEGLFYHSFLPDGTIDQSLILSNVQTSMLSTLYLKDTLGYDLTANQTEILGNSYSILETFIGSISGQILRGTTEFTIYSWLVGDTVSYISQLASENIVVTEFSPLSFNLVSFILVLPIVRFLIRKREALK